MRHHPHRQNRKQSGFVVTIELLFIATILVIGLVAGWIEIRNAVIAELSDVGEAVGALDQSYMYPGTVDAVSTATTAGSTFIDQQDTGDGFSDTVLADAGNAADTGLTVILPPAGQE